MHGLLYENELLNVPVILATAQALDLSEATLETVLGGRYLHPRYGSTFGAMLAAVFVAGGP
jgi:hypothetical protein